MKRLIVAVALVAVSILPAAAADRTPAKVLFSQVTTPADLATRTVGFYARGCLGGCCCPATLATITANETWCLRTCGAASKRRKW